MMGTMKSATRTQLPSTEQLTLLPATSTPARFRLSKDTRERGLRHVAEIRQMLAARSDGAGAAQLRQDQAA
jgi:hypothetical protein